MAAISARLSSLAFSSCRWNFRHELRPIDIRSVREVRFDESRNEVISQTRDSSMKLARNSWRRMHKCTPCRTHLVHLQHRRLGVQLQLLHLRQDSRLL